MTVTPEPAEPDEFQSERDALDAKQVGEIMHRSARWVRGEWASGRLPYSFRVGQSRYLYREELRAHMRATS